MSDATDATRTKVNLPKLIVELDPPYKEDQRLKFYLLRCGDDQLCTHTTEGARLQEIAHRCNVHDDLRARIKTLETVLGTARPFIAMLIETRGERAHAPGSGSPLRLALDAIDAALSTTDAQPQDRPHGCTFPDCACKEWCIGAARVDPTEVFGVPQRAQPDPRDDRIKTLETLLRAARPYVTRAVRFNNPAGELRDRIDALSNKEAK